MDSSISSHQPRSRPRPTLSCFECRRKKLRCDRSHPCEQCIKSHRALQCSYATEAATSTPPTANGSHSRGATSNGEGPSKRPRTDDYRTTYGSVPDNSLQKNVEGLLLRVSQLERQMRNLTGNQTTSTTSVTAPIAGLNIHPTSVSKTGEDFLTIKKDRTRFNGTVKQLLHRAVGLLAHQHRLRRLILSSFREL